LRVHDAPGDRPLGYLRVYGLLADKRQDQHHDYEQRRKTETGLTGTVFASIPRNRCDTSIHSHTPFMLLVDC
jgi:hypothetical protein